jgi:AcrR family transcriptional regulator
MGLRERQRAFTEETIRLTAVRLFLTRGSAATTVHEIAALAGVSSRTFFRYFDTKESAALPSLAPFVEVLGDVSPTADSLSGILSDVDAALAGLIEETTILDAAASHDFFVLLGQDAAVRDAAGALLIRLTDLLLATLRRAAPQTDALTLRLAAGHRVAMFEAVWSHWHCALRDAGGDVEAVELPSLTYRRVIDLRRQP